MTVEKFYELLNKRILVLDGATGTELQKRGMPNGVCPEKWIYDNPQIIKEVQFLYKKSGSDVVYTPTFGGTRLKLDEFGFGEKVYEINKKLASFSREIMGNDGYVAGDIAPTGKFVEPFGELKFEDAVNVYKEQAKALYDGGVDFFIIETMIDIQETRAAVIAIKEICDLPIVACMTFTEDERTLTGTDPVTAVITLQSLGVHAVGCNCSVGPDSMVKIIKKIKPYSKVPLVAKPNAGLPKLIDGKTVFDMSAHEFASFIPQFVDAGVNMIGGCCGTSFEFIKKIKEIVKDAKPQMPVIKSISAVSSARGNVMLGPNKPVCIIGERINPTGKKKLQEELRENKFNEVKRLAIEQSQNGADILDVNVGTSGINEKEAMIEAVKVLATITNLPLAIDSSNPDVIEGALRIYPGRALINSVSKKKKIIRD
jgi:5-methyltetrahydrofolate--homocysteine methyltransferase